MTETEHAQWIRQFWKDKLDEIKEADRMSINYMELKEVIERDMIPKSVLEQIRAEIEKLDDKVCQQFLIEDIDKEVHHTYRECIEIIDKYKVKSEEQTE